MTSISRFEILSPGSSPGTTTTGKACPPPPHPHCPPQGHHPEAALDEDLLPGAAGGEEGQQPDCLYSGQGPRVHLQGQVQWHTIGMADS